MQIKQSRNLHCAIIRVHAYTLAHARARAHTHTHTHRRARTHRHTQTCRTHTHIPPLHTHTHVVQHVEHIKTKTRNHRLCFKMPRSFHLEFMTRPLLLTSIGTRCTNPRPRSLVACCTQHLFDAQCVEARADEWVRR